MSTTVRMSKSQYNEHIKLYNRFAVLDSGGGDEELSQIAQPVIDTYYRVTTGELEQCILARQYRRKRERRKARNPAVREAEVALSNNSLKFAKSADEAFKGHQVSFSLFINYLYV
ncbi:hypothetical protein DFQ29_002073 [Apophysomyces sp. BC1021]|nr:hypothetical protein DFQ29_002073 [Apophysomyces sp. BC1021]